MDIYWLDMIALKYFEKDVMHWQKQAHNLWKIKEREPVADIRLDRVGHYTRQPAGYLFFKVPLTSLPKPRG